ncbi:MAG: sulfite exporter TauE/SafE family protein [Gammaproteobacteria bacterium]|nr:sulfite exporter TauE/SafE family protein [Gammaproteobacteria bacterium]
MAWQEHTLITDPWFYAAAIPAVYLCGISKGGFGGGLGVMAVPLMALVISPVQAAAILLPILCVMDLVALWKFRGKWRWPELQVLLPASLLGILVGTLLFGYMSASVVRLIVGIVAITFTLHFYVNKGRSNSQGVAIYPRSYGLLGGSIAGFTSFIAHAGGPPVSMYLLHRQLNRTDFAATTILFFAVVNYVKLIPYAWLEQLDTGNLATSAALVILAPAGVLTGAWLHKRVSDQFFFAVVYFLLFIVGLKLVYDGLGGLL